LKIGQLPKTFFAVPFAIRAAIAVMPLPHGRAHLTRSRYIKPQTSYLSYTHASALCMASRALLALPT
jgi:hypothetical protein